MSNKSFLQLHRSRMYYLDQWITEALISRLSKLLYFDPWNHYDFAYVLREYESYCEFIDKQQQDFLTKEIRDTFHDFRDFDYIRSEILCKCRHILTFSEQ